MVSDEVRIRGSKTSVGALVKTIEEERDQS
jgi:hypothetical protein